MSYFGAHSFGAYDAPAYGYLGEGTFLKPAGKNLTPVTGNDPNKLTPVITPGGGGKVSGEKILDFATGILDIFKPRQPEPAVVYQPPASTDWQTYALYGVGGLAVLFLGYKFILPAARGY